MNRFDPALGSIPASVGWSMLGSFPALDGWRVLFDKNIRCLREGGTSMKNYDV